MEVQLAKRLRARASGDVAVPVAVLIAAGIGATSRCLSRYSNFAPSVGLMRQTAEAGLLNGGGHSVVERGRDTTDVPAAVSASTVAAVAVDLAPSEYLRLGS